ncbi:MAG: hypothetical protein SOW25_04885 [Helicobacter sp.]|nr:hypothetical protein [Helicobacteraceae bacterium]MDY3113648.1 hypothetical protein [Helicobacter sp.]
METCFLLCFVASLCGGILVWAVDLLVRASCRCNDGAGGVCLVKARDAVWNRIVWGRFRILANAFVCGLRG